MAQNSSQTPPRPDIANPRFTLELEFVLSLANPHYISHLAVTCPHLLGVSSSSGATGDNDSSSTSSDARAFAAYLAYLYSYWKLPEYAQFLTHPQATLRILQLLQEEPFRQAVIRPQIIEALLGAGSSEESSPEQGDADKGIATEAAAGGNAKMSAGDSNGAAAT